MIIAGVISACVFVVFLICVYLFGPAELPGYKHLALALLSAFLAGASAWLLTGGIFLKAQWKSARGITLSIQAFGGAAVFVLVLLWWHSDFAPKKAASAQTPLAPIIDNIVSGHAQRLQDAYEQAGNLREQVRAAIARAEEAERRGERLAGRALEAVRRSGDTARLLEFLIEQRDPSRGDLLDLNREIAAVAYLRGEIDIAMSAVQEILKAAPHDIVALTLGGHLHRLRGELKEAEAAYKQVLILAKAQGHSEGEAVATGNLGVIYWTWGDLDEAERMHRKSLEINERLGRQEGMANAYGNLGLIYWTRGDLDEAERMLRKGLEIDERLGRQEGMANAYGNLGVIYTTRGDLDEADRMLRKAIEIHERLGWQEGMAKAYGSLGLIHLARGELDEAERMLRKALKIDERLGRQEGMTKAYGNLGVIYKRRGDLDEAERMYRKALETNERLGSRGGMANAYGNLGLVARDRGRIEQAREFWTKARDLFAGIGMPHRVQKVQGLLDGLSGGKDSPGEGAGPE